jgi:uncharacterized membrane protein YecN with MAPEG domain
MLYSLTSSWYAGLCGLVYIVLAGLVVKARWRYRVNLGAGSEPGMERAIRVHANFAEYVPLLLVLLVLAEMQGLPATAVHAAGCVLIVSRVLHAWGLSRHSGRSFGRFYGTVGTLLLLASLSIYLAARPLLGG